jgi:hypothetical protein
MSDDPDPAPPRVRVDAEPEAAQVDPFPQWFTQFLNDRQTRKPSAHTLKAYRQDFVAIATLVTGGNPAALAATDITKESMRAAFAAYAHDHEAASIRTVLVLLECVVHLPLYERAVDRQSHAVGRPAKAG